MSEHKTAAVTQQDPIIQMLSKYKNTIASVLPKHLTPERMLRVASTVIFRTPKLRQCTPLSLVNSVIEISMLGLDIGRTAHIVPFKDQATVIIDYKGYIELAHRSGQVNSFPFKPVYENDIFDYEEGTNRYIRHKPAADDRGDLTAAYAIVNFKHGGYDFEVVHPADIKVVKKRAPGAKKGDSPWNNKDVEWTMWCKTAVRRLAKRIPQSPELQRAAELEDLIEAGLKQQISHVAEGIIDADFEATTAEAAPQSDPKDAINQKLDDLTASGQISPAPDTGETSEGEQEPETTHPCPYTLCSFVAKSERGLKKHVTQQHPEVTKSGADNSEAQRRLMEFLGRATEIADEIGKDAYIRALQEQGYNNINDVPPEKEQEILNALSREIDKKNE